MSKKITLRFIGTDGWSRCVFKGNDENYYKTVELDPVEGFLNVSCEEQIALLQTLHTTDEPDGEPLTCANWRILSSTASICNPVH